MNSYIKFEENWSKMLKIEPGNEQLTDGQTDGRTDGRTEGRMDGRTDRQTLERIFWRV